MRNRTMYNWVVKRYGTWSPWNYLSIIIIVFNFVVPYQSDTIVSTVTTMYKTRATYPCEIKALDFTHPYKTYCLCIFYKSLHLMKSKTSCIVYEKGWIEGSLIVSQMAQAARCFYARFENRNLLKNARVLWAIIGGNIGCVSTSRQRQHCRVFLM